MIARPENRAAIIYIGQFLSMAYAWSHLRPPSVFRAPIGLLVIGDLSYFVLVYVLGLPTGSATVVLSTAPFFGLAFALFTAAMLKDNGRKLFRLSLKPIDLTCLTFFVMVAVFYIAVPATNRALHGDLGFSHVSYAINLLFTVPMVLVCFLRLTNSVDYHNQLVLTGLFCLGLLDIGIQLEDMRQGSLSFTLYDVLWFGAVTAINSSIERADLGTDLIEQPSIVNLTKKIFFGAGLVAVAIAGGILGSTQGVSPMHFLFLMISIFLFGIACANALQFSLAKFNDELSGFHLVAGEDDVQRVLAHSPLEFRTLLQTLIQVSVDKKSAEVADERRRLIELSDVYHRMAHDIASPLSVLRLITQATHDLDQERRELISFATDRVRDIADDILGRRARSAREIHQRMQTTNASDLFTVIATLCAEKNLEFGSTLVTFVKPPGVETDLRIVTSPSELCRILSNVINNSFAARSNDLLQINVGGEIVNEALILRIRDNGPGFPYEVLSSALNQPFDRLPGHGTGLFNAKRAVNGWLGRMTLTNEPSACVTLILRTVTND